VLGRSRRAPVYLSLLDAKGRRVGSVLHEPGANDYDLHVQGPIHEAAGFELTAQSRVVRDASSRKITPRSHYQLNSPMQEALDSSLWRLTNTVGTFSVFKAGDGEADRVVDAHLERTVSHVKNVAYAIRGPTCVRPRR